jgi:hypothetical protein
VNRELSLSGPTLKGSFTRLTNQLVTDRSFRLNETQIHAKSSCCTELTLLSQRLKKDRLLHWVNH